MVVKNINSVPGKRGPKPGQLGNKIRDRLKKEFINGRKIDEEEMDDIYSQAKLICKMQIAALSMRSQKQLLSLPEAKSVQEYIKTALMLDYKQTDIDSSTEISEENIKHALKLLNSQENNDKSEQIAEDDQTTKSD